MSVIIETTKGCFTVDLYVDCRPKLCRTFLKLCKMKFYNFSLFHSIQPDFIAQTGKSIMGKDGDKVMEGDAGRPPKISHNKMGLISMIGSGEEGSNNYLPQFFFTLSDDLKYLDPIHSVFGEIVENKDEIIQTFNETIVDGEQVPYQDLRITHTVILHDPFDDDEGFPTPPPSPEYSPELVKTNRIAADENFDEYEDKTPEEIAEIMKEKEAKARATILEMIGDLPDADCAPPENVLFVCRLNPVTTDEDLEIIFSRFGKVVSCEVIRDKKTGDSLQYAFVEFESQKICESAYFKMDNVLIDDRRIHVDFSQSVSKYRWKGKGRLEVMGDKDNKRNHGSRERHNDRNRDSHRDKRDQRDYRDRRDHRDHRRYNDRSSSNNRKDDERRDIHRRDDYRDNRRDDRRKYDGRNDRYDRERERRKNDRESAGRNEDRERNTKRDYKHSRSHYEEESKDHRRKRKDSSSSDSSDHESKKQKKSKKSKKKKSKKKHRRSSSSSSSSSS